MKKLFSALAVLLIATGVHAQDSQFFEPYKSIDLRLPSVPLITNDPFISFWSPYDRLTDGTTKHWADIRKPMDGLLRVDGTVYRWMGSQETSVLGNPLLPMASDEKWTALTHIGTKPKGTGTKWAQEDYESSTNFDESQWSMMRGAFGCPKGNYGDGKRCEDDWHTNVGTEWYQTGQNNSLYIRRHMTLTEADMQKELYIKFSHDDYFYLYINGHLFVSTGYSWRANETRAISADEMKYLHEGDNVVAVWCYNQEGGAYCDFGIYENLKTENPEELIATQKNYDVLACNTYYNFTCGPVDLDVVFTAPMHINDLDLISTPINYVSYRVRPNDGKEHNVQFYYGFTPEMTVFDIVATRSSYVEQNGISYVQSGSSAQPVLKTAGDLRSIDWGYIYLPSIGGTATIADYNVAESEFAKYGYIANPKTGTIRATDYTKYPVLSFTRNLGTVSTETTGYMMVGYDERKDIRLWNKDYPGYWARNGKTIFEAFEEFRDNYYRNMLLARDMDILIYDDGFNTGGKKYAELLSGTYRHCLAAHKLFQDEDGDLMYFSKENNSNGCVNTVDLTYPSAPIFLAYNPELEKGMITSILKYCKSGRWNFDYAAHDLGTYPHANGNVYGNPWANDGSTMPLEENANIITLAAYIAKLDGDLDYLRYYWDVIKRWSKYLVDYGKDPKNQLCTDDFKGFSDRNANLAVKAIMGIAAYAEIAKMLGHDDIYAEHMAIASDYAHYWVDHTRSADGTWYYMEYDNPQHWGLKYNMLWDKLWNWNIFNDEYTGDVIATDIAFYKTKVKNWGLPLDSRDATGKSDWVAWVAAMTESQADMQYFMDLEWKFANECVTRWPLSDWHWTNSHNVRGFRARSVIGGLWAPVLRKKMEGLLPEVELGIENTTAQQPATEVARYNAQGQIISGSQKGINIVKYSDGTTKKVMVK